jgi:glycosyltransferase involved in cell wall biosynthesis
MLDLIKEKGIYIAPRELEGIGMSFLEAMAIGKAVIAVNNPTMNEYIEHGKNGYLFDLKNPKEIDLSNIEQIQKNAYEFMRNGRKKWEKDMHKIIDFIKKS